jgi:alkaline phosphatase D
MNETFTNGNENPLNYDAWDGYAANKNRTLAHLYNHNISSTSFTAGDSHLSWVSDVVWLDTHPYDPKTGDGAIGVEFAGSAISSPCPFGQNISLHTANNYSTQLVVANRELQWQDSYFGMPTIATRNGYEISLANFTVLNGENKFSK